MTNSCQSCELDVETCTRLRADRAQACCTDCAADAVWVLHCTLDPKHRGPAYQRGYRDGVMARAAGITDPDVPEENP